MISIRTAFLKLGGGKYQGIRCSCPTTD